MGVPAIARHHSTDAADRWKLGGKIVEGLTGEALKVAMTLGFSELKKDDAVPTLNARIKTHIFPMASAEARELYKAGQRQGPLSRQYGEPMISYVQRRRRWWSMLKELEPKIEMSNTMLGEMLLDQSGLTANERLMIMTSTFNSLAFEDVADALVKQHAIRESTASSSYQPKAKGNGYKGGKSRVYNADAEDWNSSWDEKAEWSYYGQEDDEWYDPSSYDGWDVWHDDGYDQSYYAHWAYYGPSYADYDQEHADSWEEPWSHEALYADHQEGREVDDVLAAQIQSAYLGGQSVSTTEAYFSKGKGKGKGKSKGNWLGFGKGKKGGKPWYSRGNLSLEDRRRKLAEFKSRTKCQACGQKGHWAGDKECQKSANVAVANLAEGRKASDANDSQSEGLACDDFTGPVTNCLMMSKQAIPWPESGEEDSPQHEVLEEITPESLEMIPGHDSKLVSAQYKGRTYAEVVTLDDGFAGWVMTEKHNVPDLVRYQTWLRTCLAIDQNEQMKLKPARQRVPPARQGQAKSRPRKSQCEDGCSFNKRQLGQKPDHHEAKVGDMNKILQECVDVVAAPTPPVANMAIGRGRWADADEWCYDDPWAMPWNEWHNWHPENPMPVVGINHRLREVDMLADPGVWAILDEGCNTTCHSKAWRLNAQEKLLNKGFTMEICDANKTYNSVGANATKASKMYRIPFAIEVGPCHKSLCGVIESYELETGNDHFVPMLISLSNQSTMGLVKDMRAGTATLKDYDMQIELCRAKQNGLFCINIGAMETALRRRQKLPRNICPLRIGSEEFLETFCQGGSRRCLATDRGTQALLAGETSEDKDRRGMKRKDVGQTRTPEHMNTDNSPIDTCLDAAAVLDQDGNPVPPVSMVAGGGRTSTSDHGKVFIVCSGLRFEETERAQTRNGPNHFLKKETKFMRNAIQDYQGVVPRLGDGSPQAAEFEAVLKNTYEWHLNANNKKAHHTLWRSEDSKMVYLFVDLTHLSVKTSSSGIVRPGGGMKGLEILSRDKQFLARLEDLGDSIKRWANDEAKKSFKEATWW